MAKARPGSREGTVLAGKYRIDALLGAGGMGEVYRAENTAFGRLVAIKVLRDEHAEETEVVDRFRREAQAANLVRHPNVVDILDIGADEDGTPFIVQELLEGEDLGAYADAHEGGRLSVKETIEILAPVIDAVAFAHARNVIHRDLKPENIFLARTAHGMVPKLLDFGISRVVTPEEQRMTATGMSIGTPAYMSPEQIRADKVIDARSDVWSLGVILHEVLSGSLPFQAEAPSGLFVKIVTEPPIPLEVAAPGMPREIVAIVARCLRAKPAERYASAADLARDLRAFQSGEPLARVDVLPRAGSRPSRPELLTLDAPHVLLAGPVPDLELPAPKRRAPRGSNPGVSGPGAVARVSNPGVQGAGAVARVSNPGVARLSNPGVGRGSIPDGGRNVSEADFSDQIIPLSEGLQIEHIAPPMRAVAAPPIARATRGLRGSVEVEPESPARSLFAMGLMWAIVMGITGALVTFLPSAGIPVDGWASRLDALPQAASGAIAAVITILGIAAFILGVRANPTSWGLIIAAPGLVLDGLILAGFAVHGLPSLTGNGGLDALARLLFPWPTTLVPLGLSLVVFRQAFRTWTSRRPGRATSVAVAIVVTAGLLFGAVEIARGAGDLASMSSAS